MAMAVVSRLVSGIWRAGFNSGAIPRQQSRCCLCIASRGVHSFFFPSYRQQQQGGTRCGMRRGLVSKLTYRTSTLVPSYQNCLQTTRSERLFLTGSNWNTLQLSRELLADGYRGGGTKQLWTPVRGMASSKAKEQPRGSLWRTRSVISKETVQAVHDLKRNKDNSTELAKVFQTRIPRLLKMDLLATLSELQRQNEIELALQIFDVVRKEIWYKPDQFLYRSMMDALGRNRRIPEVEKKFQELQDEGIKPELPIYRELVGAYVRAHMLPEALSTHAKMVENGCGDDRLALQFIETGKEKEAVRIKQRRKAAEKLKAEEAALAESSSEVTVLTSTEM